MSTSQIGPNTSTKKQKKQKQPRNGNGGADDVVVATDKLLLELVLTSMCITVDHVSAAVKSVCIQTSLEEHDEEKQGEESGDASLCQIYRDTLWKYPIECALHAVNTWSLQQFGMRRKRGLQRGFPCPVDAANEVSAAETGEQEQQEVDDQQQERKSVRLRRLPYASPYPKHRHVDTRGIPDALRITRIEEDPLEARWDASGTPVPLRRNILGERYAPQSDPLRFLEQHSKSPTAIYQQMKHAVRRNLANRERERIQTLNDREKQRKQQVQGGLLSPESELEAKFDRLFENNEAGEEASRRKQSAGGAVGEEDDGDTDSESDNQSHISLP